MPPALLHSPRLLWRSFLRHVSRWAWPFTILVALIYVLTFAGFISQHTSLPYYDSYDYLTKTWTLGDRFFHASLHHKLNPNFYMSIAPADRPPFLPAVAGILLGPNSAPASVAMVWLFLRIGAILLALFLLAREFKSALFVPAAAMLIIASPVFNNPWRLYMMDESFAAFGLLAFSLIVIDDRRRTISSASFAAAGCILLFLVKPVAPAFLFPFLLIRVIRELIPLFHRRPNQKETRSTGWQPGGRPDDSAPARWKQFLRWAIPSFIGFLLALALLKLTPYGPAIREQYKAGASGLWHIDITRAQVIRLLSFLLPPWLIIAFFLLLPWFKKYRHKPVLLYTAAAFCWWCLFSFFLTYTIEDRLLGQAIPLVFTGLLLFLCQRPTRAFLITLVSLCVFTLNLLSLNGRLALDLNRPAIHLVDTLSPIPGYLPPVPEVGLVPFAKNLLTLMPPDQPTHILGVMGGMLVEPLAVNLAIRSIDPHAFNRIVIDWMPGQPPEFNLTDLTQRRWFITQEKTRSSGYTTTGLWTNLENFHLVIADPSSPLHPYFQPRFQTPLHLPWGDDTLTLWELPAPPPPSAIAAALRWIAPKFANDPRAPIIAAQLEILSKASFK